MAEKWSPNDFIEESLKRMSPEHIVLTNEPGNFVIESTFPSAPLSAITEEVRLTLSGRQTDLLVNKIKELMLLVVVELGRETGYIRKRRERIVQLRGHESKSDPNAVKSIVYDNLKHLLSPDQIDQY